MRVRLLVFDYPEEELFTRRREPTQEMLNRLRNAFEAAGIEFIAGDAGEHGVRLRASDEEAIPPIPPDEPLRRCARLSDAPNPRWAAGIFSLIVAAGLLALLIAFVAWLAHVGNVIWDEPAKWRHLDRFLSRTPIGPSKACEMVTSSGEYF
jgi:hypothetical protein